VRLAHAYKTEVTPDEEEQLPLLYHHAGTARLAYDSARVEGST